MPIFEYRCRKCGHAFEHLARNRQDVPARCVACGAPHPAKQLSIFAARADAAAGARCEACPATPTCATAGRGCCGGACHGH